jgi:hypothetical protein
VTRVAAAVLVACAAAAAAVVLNLVLLDRAASGNDRVGRLQPRVQIPATPAPRGTVRPVHGDVEHERGADD